MPQIFSLYNLTKTYAILLLQYHSTKPQLFSYLTTNETKANQNHDNSKAKAELTLNNSSKQTCFHPCTHCLLNQVCSVVQRTTTLQQSEAQWEQYRRKKSRRPDKNRLGVLHLSILIRYIHQHKNNPMKQDFMYLLYSSIHQLVTLREIDPRIGYYPSSYEAFQQI